VNVAALSFYPVSDQIHDQIVAPQFFGIQQPGYLAYRLLRPDWSIRLRAEATSETIGSTSTPKWAVRLEVEVEQKANVGDGDGPTLDDLYSLATRPFYYGSPTLAATLETGNSALRVHGVSKRGEALEQEQLEATLVRRSTVTIHCAPVTIS
jgi:hypothetical protein